MPWLAVAMGQFCGVNARVEEKAKVLHGGDDAVGEDVE
jgi:hypothetical protein